jgi:hypothetical protein
VKMREEYLDEIEGDCQVELGNRENPFAEYCLELTAEVRRLKSDLESWQDIAHDRLKNWCMFTEKSGELEQEVRRLKVENEGLNKEYHIMMNATDYENVIKLQQENQRLSEENKRLLDDKDLYMNLFIKQQLKGEGE